VLLGAGRGAPSDLARAPRSGSAPHDLHAYILVSRPGPAADSRRCPCPALSPTGAAITFGVPPSQRGSLDVGFASEGWLWLGAIAIVSTVTAITLFFAGLERVGPSTAAILSTLEPLTTVALAFLVFGESLTALQLAGAALVLGAAVSLNLRPRRRGGAEPLPA
jgi:drug/metabolite transporter (DMT)-like permease